MTSSLLERTNSNPLCHDLLRKPHHCLSLPLSWLLSSPSWERYLSLWEGRMREAMRIRWFLYVNLVLCVVRVFAWFSASTALLSSACRYPRIDSTTAVAPSGHFGPPAVPLLIEAKGQGSWLGLWTLEHSTSSVGFIVEELLKHQYSHMQLMR